MQDMIKKSVLPLDFFRYELPEAKIKRNGWNDGGLCPFHHDKHLGSFRVNTETGGFKCFSCGAGGGDIIAFIMERDSLTFREALQKLTDDWGLV